MSTSPISLASLLLPNAQTTKNTASAKAQATSSATSSTSSSASLGGSTTSSTFLNLLIKELQNQDPTAPVDSTAMVGQMISLNSLDQLISINQTLSTATTKSSTTTPVTPVKGTVGAIGSDSSAAQVAARTALLNSTQNTNAIQNATQDALDPTKALNLSTLNFANGAK
ncbi:flagellar basal-body rod modification protein FlgD [Granulicella aggregans]|jgi:flagellar basal-body rod modification protein FlgD|uniref:Basal-body rod modification protein FlgD n=1 Tax=Granulicella aggregans TaxID=474949 RepID=A0A7W7ZAL7_9BACT|nr:flagellar hook capping FlgD N-terminal domain-containing protein [Granulicella aggregans]MBB5056394.1 flagellar basal-body rod modification protein FlgD [Granulicella aggregans]